MAFYFRPLGWGEALAVGRWRYPAPYEIYDLSGRSLLINVALHHVLAPLGRMGFYGVHTEADRLLGVFSFRRQQRMLELGLGLRPDLTGQRLGLAFVQAGMAFGLAHYRAEYFRLDVALFNLRAIQVYQRAGFRPGRHFTRYTRQGLHEFMEMTRPVIDPTAGQSR